jgi:hypothetical protein|tara:strand:+ start:3714 stop:3980 length:267 start_codon:yes stop_codon:yes gene_type:complete
MADTKIEALVEIQPHVNRLCLIVLDAIKSSPDGMTCQEVENKLSMSSGTVTARINELANTEPPFIHKKGKRPNRSGRNAAVWFSCEAS